jgi:hypothetical protein
LGLHEERVLLLPLTNACVLLLHPARHGFLFAHSPLLLELEHLLHLAVPRFPLRLLLLAAGLALSKFGAKVFSLVFVAGELHLGDQLVFFQLHFSIESLQLLLLHLVERLPLGAVFVLETSWIGESGSGLFVF